MKNLKSILCIALLALAAIDASAQFTGSNRKKHGKNRPEMTVKYEGDVSVGIFAGNGTALTVGTTHGVKITDYFFAGIGLHGEFPTSDWGNVSIAPLASFKGIYPISDDFSLFLNPELGASVKVGDNEASMYVPGWGSIVVEGDRANFEYRLTAGVEYKSFFAGIGCGGAGTTSFFAKVGFKW